MKVSAFVIAGTHSGCGKTTVSLGIMAALIKRGLTVQPFKVGPDFVDPGHHRRITGRDSHNLDGWMMSPDYNRNILDRYSRDADVAVIEGVMGLFDGFSGSDESGSTAQMVKWLGLPVALVIDARAMARSAAAVALGFLRFDSDLALKGVIFNRVGSETHREMLIDAISSVPDLPVLGCLPKNEGIGIPSRHLGLITDEDFIADEDRIEKLARWIENNMDLDHLIGSLPEVGNQRSEIRGQKSEVRNQRSDGVSFSTNNGRDYKIKIGIARDEAFCFYYEENLRLLREGGAELIAFSPLRSKHLPDDIRGLILGGGYPELHCQTLSGNKDLVAEIREFGLSGKPIYAECGGFMFLTKEIRDLDGQAFPMVGIFPMRAKMEHRLKALGYREVVTIKDSILGTEGTKVRGHEFHYSQIQSVDPNSECIYTMTDRKALLHDKEGFVKNRVLGSYIHLHWGSNQEVAKNLVDYCRRYGA
ncbi:MAG: cobyrinic acid a,c-diamide synthase [Desulfobacteraceae bacterium 4484_190.1]|nr:MAG: cobyrinic acid a,c-diamide synthase [Desulfobacteraceae bacterium 4484_190.1]